MVLYDVVNEIKEALETDAALSAYVKTRTGTSPAFVLEGSEKDQSPPAFLVAVEKAVLPRATTAMAPATVRITGVIPAIGNGQEVCLGTAERIGTLLKTLTRAKVKAVTLEDMGEDPGIAWVLLLSVDLEVTG